MGGAFQGGMGMRPMGSVTVPVLGGGGGGGGQFNAFPGQGGAQGAFAGQGGATGFTGATRQFGGQTQPFNGGMGGPFQNFPGQAGQGDFSRLGLGDNEQMLVLSNNAANALMATRNLNIPRVRVPSSGSRRRLTRLVTAFSIQPNVFTNAIIETAAPRTRTRTRQRGK